MNAAHMLPARQNGRAAAPALRPADFVLAAALLLVALGLFLALPRAGGHSAVVTVNGARYGTYPLDQPRTVAIETEWGSNTLVIERGAAHMAHADCPDGQCLRQGAITAGSLVCLPHRIVVEIASPAGPDAVSS